MPKLLPKSLARAPRWTFRAVVLLALAPGPCDAMQAGWFHLRGTVRDPTGGHALRAIDVWDRELKVSGFVQLNSTLYARDSQLWEELHPVNGPIDVIRLRNKLTGQCLADSVSDKPYATIRPCGDEATLWHKLSRGDNRWVFFRITKRPGFFSDIKACLSKNLTAPDYASTPPCTDAFLPEDTWEAYVSG